MRTLVKTGIAGTQLDPEAIDPVTGSSLPVTTVAIERDGFRGNALVVSVGMGEDDNGWAGIYLIAVRK